MLSVVSLYLLRQPHKLDQYEFFLHAKMQLVSIRWHLVTLVPLCLWCSLCVVCQVSFEKGRSNKTVIWPWPDFPHIFRIALRMVLTTNLQLAVLWAIAKSALAICTTFLAQIARSRACPILKFQAFQATRDSRAFGNMQYPTSRGNKQLAAANSKQRSTLLAAWQVGQWRQSCSGCRHPRFRCRLHDCVHLRLQVQVTVSAEQFDSDSTSWNRASALFPASGVRPNSIGPEVFQSLPGVCSVDESRTRPVAGASAEQTVWSSLSLSHSLCLCASQLVLQRPINGRQTRLSTWTLQQRLTKCPCHRWCCVRAVQHGDPVFLAHKSCVTKFPHQLGWETSRTVADRTSTIVASRALDTTSMCSHSENQPRNYEQSVFLHGFQCTAAVVSSPWRWDWATGPLAAHRPRRSHQCWFSPFPGHPNRNTQQLAQASFFSSLNSYFPYEHFSWRLLAMTGSCLSCARKLSGSFQPSLQHITAFLRSNVCSQLAHDRDWSQRRNELLSSICRHGLLEHQESHHSVHTHDSSREIQNLHDLGCADSTTRRNHVGRCHIHGH